MTEDRQKRIESVLSRRQENITVVLENVFDPHNISAVMRSCDAVGVQEIYVLNTRVPWQKKWGFRSSRSATKWLTVHQFTDLQECFVQVRSRYSSILTTHLATDSVSLYNLDLTQSVALVFGNEQMGVSEEVRALADGNFVIPQVGMILSLNISVACAVTLYEAYRQKNAAGHYEQPQLNRERYKELSNQWELYDKNLF
jgi:tRNA (guanosine-2'-O-)-methyltransferase